MDDWSAAPKFEAPDVSDVLVAEEAEELTEDVDGDGEQPFEPGFQHIVNAKQISTRKSSLWDLFGIELWPLLHFMFRISSFELVILHPLN